MSACKNCPDTIEQITRTQLQLVDGDPREKIWVHAIPTNWPERNRTTYLMHCPNPYRPSVAEPR